MSNLIPDDLEAIAIVGVCFVVGFIIIWTWLGARATDKKDDSNKPADHE